MAAVRASRQSAATKRKSSIAPPISEPDGEACDDLAIGLAFVEQRANERAKRRPSLPPLISDPDAEPAVAIGTAFVQRRLSLAPPMSPTRTDEPNIGLSILESGRLSVRRNSNFSLSESEPSMDYARTLESGRASMRRNSTSAEPSLGMSIIESGRASVRRNSITSAAGAPSP